MPDTLLILFLLATVNCVPLQVNELQIGKMELPPALLHTPTFTSPYLAPWSIATLGTGAGPMRSRGDLPKGVLQINA